MPRIRVTFEADLSPEEAKVFPPDDIAVATQNIFGIFRRGYLIDPLCEKADAIFNHSQGEITKEMRDALVEAYDIEISLGKKFDQNIKVEFV